MSSLRKREERREPKWGISIEKSGRLEGNRKEFKEEQPMRKEGKQESHALGATVKCFQKEGWWEQVLLLG